MPGTSLIGRLRQQQLFGVFLAGFCRQRWLIRPPFPSLNIAAQVSKTGLCPLLQTKKRIQSCKVMANPREFSHAAGCDSPTHVRAQYTQVLLQSLECFPVTKSKSSIPRNMYERLAVSGRARDVAKASELGMTTQLRKKAADGHLPIEKVQQEDDDIERQSTWITCENWS